MSTVDLTELRRELERHVALVALGETPEWVDVDRLLARAVLVCDELEARRGLDVAGWLRHRAAQLRHTTDDDSADVIRARKTMAIALEDAARAWEEEGHG